VTPGTNWSARRRLGAAGAFAIALIAARDIEGWQPILAPDRPQLVGRLHQVRRIEAADMDFDLITAAAEQGRTADRAEMAAMALGYLLPFWVRPSSAWPSTRCRIG
jgi:hypothetical protein